MPISEKIGRASPDELALDPFNPRLGKVSSSPQTQDQILEQMKDWTLEELAVSFLESGFWTQEALVVVKETLYGKSSLVVVEGNRRLAAIMLLQKARDGSPASDRWRELAENATPTQWKRLKKIPYVLADSREEVQAYLGFRHVSGIKEWNPAEKARFIAHLIEDQGLSYDQVRKRIGSKAPTVRQNYIAYRLLEQLEGIDDERVAVSQIESRFSVLFLSLRSVGVQKYLGIDPQAQPAKAKKPVPKTKLNHFANFAYWLFGTPEHAPVVQDSRDVDRFGRILEDGEAVAYMERTDEPSLETAFRIAGSDEVETTTHVERAADEIEEALSTAHRHKKSKRLERATKRVAEGVVQLLKLFPSLKSSILDETA